MTSLFHYFTELAVRFTSKMAEDNPQAGVFDGCKLAIVRSDEIQDKDISAITKQLKLHGGDVIVDDYPEHRLDLGEVSHIISETFDFPDYYEAVDKFVPVLKIGWIHTSIASGKLAHPRKFSPDPHLFMSNVVATCADLPAGDKDAIAGGILAMGGNYSSKVTIQCTHIVALSTENEKVEQVFNKNLKMHVVLPHWFDDCLKLGKMIDEGPYLLPDPEILRGVTDIPKETKSQKNMSGAASANPEQSLPPKLGDRKSLKVFKNKKVMLDPDLGIADKLREVLNGIILVSNGKIGKSVSDADMLVCKYREGSNFNAAMLKRIDVGNLAWLYHLIVHDLWTSPLRRLLHFPLPKEPLSGFENFKISLSNYTGEARTYLENLITAVGAECTKTLKQDNTHLITAHRRSEKVSAAEDWGVKVVNHLWLEESFAKWQKLAVTTPRYVHFPARTNLSEVVGLTQIDRGVIESKFLKQKLSRGVVDTHPSSFSNSAEDDEESANDNDGSPTPKRSRPNGKLMSTPAVSHVVQKAPPSTGGRAAKQAAAAKLHESATDIALYEKERKRVGGVERGGRRKTDSDRVDIGRKRSAEASDAEAEQVKTAKKQRTDFAGPQMRLIISSYAPWVDKVKKEKEDEKTLSDLGIEIVSDASTASHVAVPKVVRTPKFLIALAQGLDIISTIYIDECLKQKEYLDPADYPLNDVGDYRGQITSIRDILRNAKANKRQLLNGLVLYCTEKAPGGFETMKSIVEANGGTLTPYRGRTVTIPALEATHSKDSAHNFALLISNDGADERRLWQKFAKAAQESQRIARVLRAEWLLRTALQQEIQPLESHEFEPRDK